MYEDPSSHWTPVKLPAQNSWHFFPLTTNVKDPSPPDHYSERVLLFLYTNVWGLGWPDHQCNMGLHIERQCNKGICIGHQSSKLPACKQWYLKCWKYPMQYFFLWVGYSMLLLNDITLCIFFNSAEWEKGGNIPSRKIGEKGHVLHTN